ncbi:hypothetical protein CYL31_01300 [Marinomonas sp. A3A]|uniref:hypothetical protein n=1 Tax=Marinomonas sp. A3A TaxID=2065312 RepID=UPI001BB43CEC|nr:hypothetical protein [Marinomonas sp. A3A]QUX90114.1 hypothetical protein CYL31_01300 [Marinomonas sp. A3A]
MITKFKAAFRGFLAGPDFRYQRAHRFTLEDKLLSITLPDSNVVAVPNTVDLHYPYKNKLWFESHCKQRDQHQFVRIITKNWMYLPPFNLIPDSEYGMLSCQLRIKRTEKINVLDTKALANYLTQEYDDFYNGPEGQNTIVRQEVEEQSANLVTPFTPEELKQQLGYALANRGYPPLDPAKQIEINNRTWVFYHEWMQNQRSFQDYYCLPLSEHCFLEAKFNHRVDRSDKHKKWKNHALQAQERIMQSITLGDIPEEKGRLIEGQVE